MSKILITGSAGFIGFHLAERLAREGKSVVGIDNINDYYDTGLKLNRLKESGITASNGGIVQSSKHSSYRFQKLDLADQEGITKLFETERFDYVVHLAAQAGVRYSLTHPHKYIEANISGFLNILESCRKFPVKHLVYASSSSVYGKNTKMPFSVSDNVDHPVSLYAASKKSNELMAHTYSHLFNIPATGLRFFTVYGPWGRPDMALFIFTRAILEGQPIQVFNNGNMKRDFTYIDDIVEGISRIVSIPAGPDPQWNGNSPDPSGSDVPHRVYNIGKGKPVGLMDFIQALEETIGKKAKKEMQPMQAGDVPATWADTTALEKDTGYRPSTDIREGIKRFVEWYKSYFGY